MGLFNRAKQAKDALGGLAGQAQAAQQMAAQAFQQAGYTDGSLPTMANAGQVNAQMQADHDVLNAYGQELNRIVAVGVAGSGVITSAIDTGERAAGNPWFQLTVEVTLPGQAPYTVEKREMVPSTMVANYQAGSQHDVKVDPADAQKIALTS